MGAPILRGNRVLGVLVVQNRTLRHYSEDEVEVLQTIAMIVAELVASGNLVNPLEIAQSHGGEGLPFKLPRVPLKARAARVPAGLHGATGILPQLAVPTVPRALRALRWAPWRVRAGI